MVAAMSVSMPALAAPPTYTLFGEASLASNAVQLVSDAAPGFGGISFGGLPLTFADLTELSADSNVTDDDCKGGSPRFSINLDTNNDTVSDGRIFVYLGPAPNFTGCTPNTWVPSGDLLEAGKTVDATQLGGGFYNDYSAALASYGTAKILGMSLVIDSGWAFGDGEQTVLIDNVKINADTLTFNLPDSPLFWAEEDTTQVKVDWKTVADATGYRVYHSPDNVTFAQVYDGAALTFTHAVAAGSDNYYRVTAYNGTGESSTTVPAKYAGARTVVIDDGAMSADFNASGTATPTGAWSTFDINTGGAEQILSFATGGDNTGVAGPFGAQTFDWVSNASLSGYYDVFVNYICDSSRGTASYDVYSGVTKLNMSPVAVNQSLKSSDGTACGSQSDPAAQPFWKKLNGASWAFSGAGRVQLVSATGDNILADAVAFHKTASFVCSNSVVEPGEQCDDGNVVNGDGCTSTCQLSAAPACNGLTATVYVNAQNKIVGGPQNGQSYTGTLNGTSGADVMVGTAGGDVMYGGNGADTMCGLGAGDVMYGEGGADWMDGGAAGDVLDGGDADDALFGRDGGDSLKGGIGADLMCGQADGDALEGSDGADKLDGGAGSDVLKGSAGTDQCRLGEANNSCEQQSNVALPECA